ncbi:hypothetical protein QP165_00035 [Sphingomonas sp. 22R3R2A-7]
MSFTGIGILAVRLAGVSASTDMKLVVENASTPLGVAGQRVGRPCRWIARSCPITSTAARGRYAFLGKAADDAAGRYASSIVFEDPYDDSGLRRHDLLQTPGTFAVQVVGDTFLIAICRAAGILSHCVPLDQSIASFQAGCGNLFGVDRPHHADLQHSDLAFLACDKEDAAELQSFVQRSNVRLASRHPVHRICEHYVNAPGFYRGE